MNAVQGRGGADRRRAVVMAVSAGLLVGCEVAVMAAAALYAVGALYLGLGSLAAYLDLALGALVGLYVGTRCAVGAYREELAVALTDGAPAGEATPANPAPPARVGPGLAT